jgi:hypothetical protein
VLYSSRDVELRAGAREARKMEKHWLRGLLLGVSLALLLGGGVALAAMAVSADQQCFVCCPIAGTDAAPAQAPELPPDCIVELTITGLDANWDACDSLLTPVGWLWQEDCYGASPPPTVEWEFGVTCEGRIFFPRQNFVTHPGAEAQFIDGVESLYGEWTYYAWQQDEGGVQAGPVSLTLEFADVCEAEFVPEPGTLVLLGSGLAGLAGYATLRLRSGKALH